MPVVLYASFRIRLLAVLFQRLPARGLLFGALRKNWKDSPAKHFGTEVKRKPIGLEIPLSLLRMRLPFEWMKCSEFFFGEVGANAACLCAEALENVVVGYVRTG